MGVTAAVQQQPKQPKSTFQRFVEAVKAMDSASPQVLQQAAQAFSTALESMSRGSCPAFLFEASYASLPSTSPDPDEPDAASGPFWFQEQEQEGEEEQEQEQAGPDVDPAREAATLGKAQRPAKRRKLHDTPGGAFPVFLRPLVES